MVQAIFLDCCEFVLVINDESFVYTTVRMVKGSLHGPDLLTPFTLR